MVKYSICLSCLNPIWMLVCLVLKKQKKIENCVVTPLCYTMFSDNIFNKTKKFEKKTIFKKRMNSLKEFNLFIEHIP